MSVCVCLCVCVYVFALVCVCFYACVWLFCLHVWGLGGGAPGFGGLRGGIQPDYFYMFVFWLKCPLKAMK